MAELQSEKYGPIGYKTSRDLQATIPDRVQRNAITVRECSYGNADSHRKGARENTLHDR